jgi:hypothetical protein
MLITNPGQTDVGVGGGGGTSTSGTGGERHPD